MQRDTQSSSAVFWQGSILKSVFSARVAAKHFVLVQASSSTRSGSWVILYHPSWGMYTPTTRVLYDTGVGLKIDNPCDHVNPFCSSPDNTNGRNLADHWILRRFSSLKQEMSDAIIYLKHELKTREAQAPWAQHWQEPPCAQRKLDWSFFCLDPVMHVDD